MKRSLLLVVALWVLFPATSSAQDARALYQDACDGGELVACTVLGLMYEAGRDVPRDPARAAVLYERACEGGEAGACINLGVLFQDGGTVGPDLPRAADLYRQACDGGQLLGCHNLGRMLESGEGVAQDFAAAVALYEQACDGGMLPACNQAGTMAQNGAGTPQNIARAVALYGRACAGGELLGCVYLGVSYERGEGTARDPTRAAQYYRTACEGGVMLGCANLGGLYRTGSGVVRSATMAATLYDAACVGGVTVACTNLGGMYEAGDGVEEDAERAAALYQRACDGGAPLACARIGAPEPEPLVAAPVDRFSRVGRVADAQTEAPLADALIDIPALGIRVVTDETGRIDLTDLPVGDFTIRAQRMGYDDVDGVLQVPGASEVLMLLNRSLVDDLDAPGRIYGRVTAEEGNQGVPAVDVAVLTPTPVRAVSDGQGRFRLSGVEPGLVDVQFERLGYEPRVSRMVVQPGRTVEIAVAISTRPIELAPIEVVTVRSRYLESIGFYERGGVERGSQFTRQDFEAINPTWVSDVLYRVPGVNVFQSQLGAQAVSNRRSGFGQGNCILQIYLDGVAVDDFNLDVLSPEQIEAIEVYQGLAVPIQYPSRCGVVLVWTRRG